jgi:UDP-GlcNAc:undecaprenyl-phosphate/decaprenyl-phosphate GlcNAc-1-phosphate transferase
MEKYIFPFLTSFLLSVFLSSGAIYFGNKLRYLGRDSKRHIHKKNVSRLGGTVIIFCFVFILIADKNLVISSELAGFLAASILLLVVGFWDDIKEIFWKFQLFFQIAVSLLVFVFGVRIYYITNPLTGGIINLNTQIGVVISVFLVIFWITLVMNAINWLDGIDGISGGVTFIAAVTIFFLSLKPEVNQPPVAIISAVLAGTLLGFLIFNFHPSRILAGTAGSMFMGFSLAVLAIFSGTKIATSLLVISIPVVDFLWVIFERIRKRKSIFRADKNHLHHKLLELGWSQKKINFFYFGTSILVAFVALNTRAIGKSETLLFTVVIMVFFLIFIQKKIEKKAG